MVQIIQDITTLADSIKKIFISHMVQIIPNSGSVTTIDSSNFISHMVQIIHIWDKLKPLPGPFTLYPTWFR